MPVVFLACVAVLITAICLRAGSGLAAQKPIGDLAPLRTMIAEAHAVVLVKTTAVKDAGNEGARVYTLDVRRTIAGSSTAKKLKLIDSAADLRPGASPKPYLNKGDLAIVLLAKRRPRATLDPTREPAHDPGRGRARNAEREPSFSSQPYTAVGGRNGVIVVADNGEIAPIEAAIGNAEQLGPKSTPGNAIGRREHVRIELASGLPRLILDALAEFERMDSLSEFAFHESKTIGRVVRNRRIDPGLRAGLIEVLSRKKAKPLLPILERLDPNDVDVFIVGLYSRAALGRPASTRELERYLESPDPHIRAAAARGLSFTADTRALEILGRVSTEDRSGQVRLAAIVSLGATRDEAALPWLTRSFAAERYDIRHAAASAVLSIDGDAADRALHDAALNGTSLRGRLYAAAVLLTRRGPSDPMITKLRATSSDEEIRVLLTPSRR